MTSPVRSRVITGTYRETRRRDRVLVPGPVLAAVAGLGSAVGVVLAVHQILIHGGAS